MFRKDDYSTLLSAEISYERESTSQPCLGPYRAERIALSPTAWFQHHNCERVRTFELHRSDQKSERRKSRLTALLWQRPGVNQGMYVHDLISGVCFHFLITRAVIAVLLSALSLWITSLPAVPSTNTPEYAHNILALYLCIRRSLLHLSLLFLLYVSIFSLKGVVMSIWSGDNKLNPGDGTILLRNLSLLFFFICAQLHPGNRTSHLGRQLKWAECRFA